MNNWSAISRFGSVCVIAATLCLASCSPLSLSYTMLSPQVSTSNSYSGREFDLSLQFSEDRVSVQVYNSSEHDMSIDWYQCSFVRPDKVAVSLIPVAGRTPVSKLPSKTRMSAVLTLAEWEGSTSRPMHRRDKLVRRLVNYGDFLGETAKVQVHVPIEVLSVDDLGHKLSRDETLTMTFSVRRVENRQ